MSTSIAVKKNNTSISTISPDNKTTDGLKNSLVKSFDVDFYIKSYLSESESLEANHSALLKCQSNIDSLYRYSLANQDEGHFPPLCNIDTAKKRLQSDHWKKILEERNMFLFMSVKEKEKWKNVFNELETPEFNRENIALTFRDIANSSPRYFAERIVSTLSHLSKTHLTNSQFGFGEKMIFDKIHSGFTGDNYIDASICVSSIDPNTHKTEYLDEIRKIVAYLSDGNLESLNKNSFVSSYQVIEKCLKKLALSGKSYFTLDQGRIQIKVFKIGTVHLYIEPEIAQKMNEFVSVLYPNQIPSKLGKSYFKGNVKKDIVEANHLSFRTINFLNALKTTPDYLLRKMELNNSNTYHYFIKESVIRESLMNSEFKSEFDSVIKFLEGRIIEGRINDYEFDYDISEAIDTITLNGYIDDTTSHQQYYTKENVALDAYEMLTQDYNKEELEKLSFLEPSCGRGALLGLLPKKSSLGVDISEINTSILKSKGFKTIKSDFVDYSNKTKERFDCILMNPPYTKNQGFNHTLLSYKLLNKNGVLVAILPTSLRDSFDFLEIENATISKSKNYVKCFDNTNISVFIIKIKI